MLHRLKSAYDSFLSLSLHRRGVERAKRFTLISLLFFCFSQSAGAAELIEPTPLPQIGLPRISDYAEAELLIEKHRWPEATIVLRTVVKNMPDFAPAVVDLARSLTYSNRREEALSVLSQKLSREKGPARARLIERSKVISRLFLTNTTFQTFQDGLNLMLARKYRLAREKFERALTQEADNVEIITREAQALVLDGDYDTAAEKLRLARKLNPYEPEIRLWLGRALFHRGEIPEAIENLRIAEQELSDSELAPVWLSEALESGGQYAGAVDVLEHDLKQQPYHVLDLLSLAKLRMQNRNEGRPDDKESLWSARKELQLATSRLEKYSSSDRPRFEGELGLEQKRTAEEIKAEIQKLLVQIESSLEK